MLPRTIYLCNMDRNAEQTPLRIAIYLRVSTDEQVDKYGLDAQRASVEGLIKSKGKLDDGTGRDKMVLAGENYIYVDNGISGTVKIQERPAFSRLIEDITHTSHKPFDMVAVFKIDRFARKLTILMDILDLFERHKIEFVSATESIDTSTPFGRAMLGIMGVIAELERETIFQRTQLGRESAIKKGKHMGGYAPFGYQKDENGRLAILQEEAEIVRKIFNYFVIEKYTPQKIADLLTESETLSPDASAVHFKKHKGKTRKRNAPYFWRAEGIRKILSDEVYIGVSYNYKSNKGKRLPKDQWVRNPISHEKVILNHIFALVQQSLKDLADRKTLIKHNEENRLYLLSSLLKCDHCRAFSGQVEGEMTTWTGGRKKLAKDTTNYSYYYFCGRKNRKKYSTICPVVPVPAEPIEEYVIDFIKQLLSNPQAVYDYQNKLKSTELATKQYESDKKTLEGNLEALPERRKNIRIQHELNYIDTPTLQKEMQETYERENMLKKKISELDLQLSQITLSKGYEVSIEKYAEKYGKSLEKMTDDKAQLSELIHGLIHEIIVYSRPRKEGDVIAGRKKDDQFIPERVDIALNLPQQLLHQLYTQKFGVRNDNL